MGEGASWRVVLISQIPEIVQGFAEIVRELGHEPVAHIFARRLRPDMVPPPFAEERTARVVGLSPPELDLVMPASREGVARALRAYEPDLALCLAFPWRIPADALAVPRLGIVNGHPSLLPDYRGPTPISWAIRSGEPDVGMSFHLMDERFDTGPLLAQEAIPVDDEETFDSLNAKLAATAASLLPRVFDRLARGERGEPQREGGSYQSLFELEYALIDLSRSAREVHDQVRAWRLTPFALGERGAILERGGERVRVVRTSLVESDGAQRIECAGGPLWILETEPV